MVHKADGELKERKKRKRLNTEQRMGYIKKAETEIRARVPHHLMTEDVQGRSGGS